MPTLGETSFGAILRKAWTWTTLFMVGSLNSEWLAFHFAMHVCTWRRRANLHFLYICKMYETLEMLQIWKLTSFYQLIHSWTRTQNCPVVNIGFNQALGEKTTRPRPHTGSLCSYAAIVIHRNEKITFFLCNSFLLSSSVWNRFYASVNGVWDVFWSCKCGPRQVGRFRCKRAISNTGRPYD